MSDLLSLLKSAFQRASWRFSLVLLPMALSFGAATGVATTSGAAAQARDTHDGAVVARVVALNVTENTRLVSRAGHVINEQGTVSGTLSGTVYVHSTALSSTSGVSTFQIRTKGGTLSARANTKGRVVGATLYFTGTATITGGTGTWAHASGTGLSYSGSMDRQNFHATGRAHGTIHL